MEAEKSALPGELTVHANLWIQAEDLVVLSRWRVRLLEAIEATGSIRAAAAQMQITYDLAWHRVDEMETALGAALVDRQRGGYKGGSAQLTALGRDLISRFNAFSVRADACVVELFEETFGDERWRAFLNLRKESD
jgi:molybdate transport system regulatory protein